MTRKRIIAAIIFTWGIVLMAQDRNPIPYGQGNHTSIVDAEKCISVEIKPIPKVTKEFEVFVTNNCGSKLLLTEIKWKYFDKDGYRVASDSDADGLLIPQFDAGEKIKKRIPYPINPAGIISAKTRDIFAIK